MAKKRSTLPPGLIVRTGKFVWNTMWHTMMSQMAPRNKSGAYIRPESEFRHRHITPEAGRYFLIVGMSCPWAHRTLVTRVLKGLTEVIDVFTVYPSTDEGRWLVEPNQFEPNQFEPNHSGAKPAEPKPAEPKPAEPLLADCHALVDVYERCQPGYKGRATVPVLCDRATKTIVNNESADIIEILNGSFNDLATGPDLYPAALKSQIDSLNQKIYDAVNNGVYRCGFAQTQDAYNQAVTELFGSLDELDSKLESQRYLCGTQITLADIRLFTTLIRFDVAYHGLFKCDHRRISDYSNLSSYLRDIYQIPGIAETCDIEAVKRDYYGNLFPLNPGGIVPIGPGWDGLSVPHHRDHL